MQLPAGWSAGQPSSQATLELLQTLRSGSPSEASEHVAQLLQDGVAVQSLYDALFAGAAELLMRQRGIVSLHAVTTTNAMHFAFWHAANPQTRQLVLLQNAAFLPLFRQAMQERGSVRDTPLEQLAAAPEVSDARTAVEQIFDTLTDNRDQAAQQVLSYLQGEHSVEDLVQVARRLIFQKGNDSHDYKFSSAVLEDYYQISPAWRDRYLAASVFQLRGSQEPDNSLIARTRTALGDTTG
jgi:DNA polymerase III gamma/tau subunit